MKGGMEKMELVVGCRISPSSAMVELSLVAAGQVAAAVLNTDKWDDELFLVVEAAVVPVDHQVLVERREMVGKQMVRKVVMVVLMVVVPVELVEMKRKQ